jgi:hypothetical protein
VSSMIRGNRLIVPLNLNEYGYIQTHMGGTSYQADIGQRMELSLEECESIITHLPLIVTFVMEERQKIPQKEAKK